MLVLHDDIFNCTEEVICHQVNTLGYMGKGLALQVRRKYPKVYDEYKRYVDRYKDNNQQVPLGNVQVLRVEKHRCIANLFAQATIKEGKLNTHYHALVSALENLLIFMIKNNLYSLAIPYGIGCNLGGGDWNRVYSEIEELSIIYPDINIVLYKK